MNLRLLNLAHIQNIIQQAEQMLRRNRNLVKIILHLISVVQIRQSQRCHTYNGIHGRPDIVAHRRQKITFHAACLFCLAQCPL